MFALTDPIVLHSLDFPSKQGDDSMIRSLLRASAIMGLVASTGLATSAAWADPVATEYEVNYGNGICATVSCGQYGCSVIDYHYCPREVGGG